MTVPVFEEYEPALDCSCAGCAAQRRERARGLSARAGGHAAAHGARRALVLATAAGVAWTGTAAGAAAAVLPPGHRHGGAPASGAPRPVHAAPAVVSAGRGPVSAGVAPGPDPATPQGGSGPLQGVPVATPGQGKADEMPRTTRAEIISRAKTWVAAQVPYSMTKYWSDGYRQDCSGYVSMAWGLPGNEWTGSLAQFGVKIARADLQPGDILLFHNPTDPSKGSHVTIFGGWTDASHTHYLAYEQTPPHTRAQATPMAYWTNSDKYVPYRYKGLTDPDVGAASPASGVSAAYPGASSFGPGEVNAHVTQLGTMLVARGGRRFYQEGPGPRWSDADRQATKAFQEAQGWHGAEADGLPGPETWRYLVQGLGQDIPPAGSGRSARGTGHATGAGPAQAAPVTAHTMHPPHTTGTGRTTAHDAPFAGHAGGRSAVPPAVPAYPGARYFGPGRTDPYVEQLGRRLVAKGFGTYYTAGPSPAWSEADRRNVAAFQRAQGWTGSGADGIPGPETWRRLFA
jgi:hypothetical protein